MRRRAILLLLAMTLLLSCMSISALAADSAALDGWDGWSVHSTGDRVAMTCPGKDPTVETMLSCISMLVAENQQQPSNAQRHFLVIFTFTRANYGFSSVVNLMTQRVMPAVCGLWPCPESYAYVSASVSKTASEYQILLAVEINGGYRAGQDMDRLYRQIRLVGNTARSESDTPAEEVVCIDRWLAQHVQYRNSGAVSENEAYGALVEGYAVCGGYTEAALLICRYLGIPCTTIRNSGHIWNQVYIDGGWLHWDATWSDGDQPEKYRLVPDIQDSGHCYDTEALAANRANALVWQAAYRAPADLWCAAQTLHAAGILQGDTSGAYAFNRNLTHAELAVFIMRFYRPAASDIPSIQADSAVPAWAADSVAWCIRNGFLPGKPAEQFDANAPVSTDEFQFAVQQMGVQWAPASSDRKSVLRADAILALHALASAVKS